MSAAATFVRALDHSVSAIHGDHKPNLAQLISAAWEADKVRSAALIQGGSSESVIDHLEDTAWLASVALRAHLNSIGVGPELQRQLSEVLA